MEKSPFWMEISPFTFFFEKRFEPSLKKKSQQRIFSIQNGEISILNGDFSIHLFFQKRFEPFFLKKKTQQRIFSIQNGEIFHSEWRFLHSLFFRSVLNLFFENKSQQRIFSISEWRNLHSEWRFLHSLFFEKRFEPSFKTNPNKEFSPFRMEESPFWNGDFSIRFFLRSVLNLL